MVDAVIDTNVVASAVISPRGAPAQIISAWRAGAFTWVTSRPLLDELKRVLRSRRLKRYIAWSDDEIDELLLGVEQAAKIAAPPRRLSVIKRDPADDRLLEAALAAQADYIVSGDHDLLDLRSYQDIPVISPVRFLAVLATMEPTAD